MNAKTNIMACGLLVFLCTYLPASFGQTQISGTVTDAAGMPLQAASVLLLNAKDSVLVKGQLSGNDGSYVLENVAGGTYRVGVSMLGYTYLLSDPFTVDDQMHRKMMGTMALQEDAAQLKEVSIVAKKPLFEQRVDRLVVNVANSITNISGTALDVLQRSPGILLSRQTNTLSMSGKSGVIIMINGKISRMPPEAVVQMLAGMNASNIERIELIHTPPANFDAEGSAGIINIVLKKTADDGLNGGYSLNAGYGRREKYGAGLHFNYRKKIVNLFGSYDYSFNHNPQTFVNYRGIEAANGDFLETDGYSDRRPDLTNQNARLGADFQVSPKTVVGVLGTYFDRNWDMDAVNHINYSTNGALDHRVQMLTKEINRWTSWTSNLNLNHQFTKDKTLSIDLDYVYYKIHNPSSYVIQDFKPDGNLNQETAKRIGKETPINITVAKADYNQNIGKNIQFETGLKGSMSRFDNDVRVEDRLQETWAVDPVFTSRFQLKEDIAAAYTSFSIKANDKTDVKLGVRYEYTTTNLGSVDQPNVVDRTYGSWFPSAFVSRKITEDQSLNLSYSRRIFRPGFTQLAPYLIFYDPTTVEGGNPALQPVFVDAVRTSYRYKTWQLTVEYNFQNPSIYYLPIVDVVNNTQFNQPANNGHTHTAYADLNFPVHPCKWWEMQNDMFVAYQKNSLVYENSPITTTSRFGGFNSTQSFTLPKQFSIEVSGNFITPGYDGLSHWKPNGQLNIGIQKKLGEEWGSLSLSANDIFESSNFLSSIDQPDINLRVSSAYKQAERVFMLTWTNKFGNTKLKDARQRASGAADEMRRL